MLFTFTSIQIYYFYNFIQYVIMIWFGFLLFMLLEGAVVWWQASLVYIHLYELQHL